MAEPRQLVLVATILTVCFLLFHRSSSTLPPTPAGTLCVPRERDALLDFKADLTDPSNSLSSWRGAECCGWMGVVCSNQTGHVITIQINGLGGQIPQEIGMLVALKNFNFSWNSLTGIIPESIGELHALESLDLSHNGLSGEIPTSLSNLTSLSHLNLSYNNLIGIIPSGNQLRTLDDQASSYIHNPGLCGPPLPRSCSRTDIIPYDPEEHDNGISDVLSLYLSLCIGFIVGLWIVFCGFLFKRKWMVGWFSYTDHMYDRAHVQVVVGWDSLARKIHQG